MSDATTNIKPAIPAKKEVELHSSMKLMFGRTSAWQVVNNKAVEYGSIFECSGKGRGGHYTGDKFAQSNFWRSTVDRFWQYDDFTFDGIAAASYLINAHKYKIWFNPAKFYDYLYMCVAYEGDFEVPESVKEDEKKLKEYHGRREKEWGEVISGTCKKYEDQLNKYGFDRALAQALKKCEEKKTWEFNTWIRWCNTLVINPFVSQNCESVFVHEMFHIIWNHLSRVEERDSVQWNIATDFAINQSINFTKEFAAGLITDHNEKFHKRFVLSTIKYLMQTDADVAKSLKEDYKITEKTDWDKISPKLLKELHDTYMMESPNGYSKSSKFANKSGDLYYRILLESCIIMSGAGMAGYDSHGKWNDKGEGSGEGMEGDQEGAGGKKFTKGASKGTETCEKAKEGDKPDWHPDSNKERGKGGRQEHKGFDSMEAAAARREVKATVKDTLERCGVNPDDPEEIEKALKATPGMEILGALILDWFKVKRKNWKQLLKKELTNYSNPQDIDYTMSRESRVMEGFFPGKKRERGLDVIFQVDTSGSINLKDWNDFVNQIEEIARSCDVKLMRCLQVHSVIACDEMVNLRKVKDWRIKETGGTTMALGPVKLRKEGNKKLLIIFTDGYTDVFEQKDFPFKIMIFLSRGNSHNTEIFKERGFTVINQDEE